MTLMANQGKAKSRIRANESGRFTYSWEGWLLGIGLRKGYPSPVQRVLCAKWSE